jgi:tetratricopeptide (TPR) repeat protein
MKFEYSQALRYILKNFHDFGAEDEQGVSAQLLETFGRLPEPIPYRDSASLSSEDQVLTELLSRLPTSPPWKIAFLKNAHIVLVRLNGISLCLCALSLLFTVHIADKIGAPLSTTVVGAVVTLLFLAIFLLTRFANLRFVDFLFVFLKDGDLPWFFATNLFIFDLASRNSKSPVKNLSLESRRTNVSTLLIRKFAQTFEPHRIYQLEKLLLFYCALDELRRREASIHATVFDSDLRIVILNKLHAFSQESALISFHLGLEYFEKGDVKTASSLFEKAFRIDKNSVLFESYFKLSQYVEGVVSST